MALKHRPTVSSVAATAILAAAIAIPGAWLDGLVECPFRALAGLPCPGCGLSHAFVALGHLDISSAWQANPAVFVILPVIIAFAAEQWLESCLTHSGRARALRWSAVAIAAALLGSWVYTLIAIHTGTA